MVQHPLLCSGRQGRSNDAVGIYYSNLHDRKRQLCLLVFSKENKSGGDHYHHKMVEGKAQKGTVSINKWWVRKRITPMENGDGASACYGNSPGPCPILSFHPSIRQMFHKGLMLYLVPRVLKTCQDRQVPFLYNSNRSLWVENVIMIFLSLLLINNSSHSLHRRHLNP